MVFPRPNSTTPQNQVPIIKNLCESLGYGAMPERQTLLDSTHEWRRSFTCDDGTLGKDLIDWTSARTHKNLTSMTREYLDRGGNGSRFWPQPICSLPRTIPKYPDDKSSILSLLYQVFWRQNINEAKNAKNPAKRHLLQEISASSKVGGSNVVATPSDEKPSSREATSTHRPQQNSASHSPVSSSEPPRVTTSAILKTPSPPGQADTDSESIFPTMEEIMDSTPRRERSQMGPSKPKGNDGKTPDICGPKESGNEGHKDPARKCSNKPQAPVAQMVPEHKQTSNPMVEAAEDPFVESLHSESAPDLAETQRRRRRIAMRFDSEEGDEDYSPRKSKRKRVALPKLSTYAHKSGSVLPRESIGAQQQAEKSPSSSKETSHQDSVVLGKRTPSFNDAALIERFQSSKNQHSPSVPDLTQEQLASTSWSQPTVDVIQQNPAMGGHTDSSSAEAEIAHMDCSISSVDADPSRDPKPQELVPQKGPISQQEAHQTPWYEYPTQQMRQTRLDTAAPKSPSNYSPSLVSPQTPTNDLPPRGASPRRAAAESTTLVKTELISPKQGISEAQEAPQPFPADQIQTLPESPPTPFTAARPLHPKPASHSPSNNIKSSLDIRYTIIKSRHPRLTRRNWATGSLTGKTMDSFCAEIAAITGRPVLDSILFTLAPSHGAWETEDEAQRGKPGEFERIREDFVGEIKREKRMNNSKKSVVTTGFTITIEPDPGAQQLQQQQQYGGGGKLSGEVMEGIKVEDESDDDVVEIFI